MKCLRYFLLFGLVVLLFSCNKFKGSQEIPSYIRIEPWTFTTNYEIEGAATSAIVAARLHIDDDLRGVYAFKQHDDGYYAQAPILKEGNHKITLLPIIKLNGISSTQVNYPFYQSYIVRRDLTPAEVVTLNPSTKYYSVDSTLVRFKLIEDFENINNVKVNRPEASYGPDTTYAALACVSHAEDPNAWIDPVDPLNHFRSGHVHVGDSIKRFRLESIQFTNLPTEGRSVILEIDYKCDSEVLVGLELMMPQDGLLDKPLVYLRTTDTWKKTYINFSPTITDYYDAAYVYFYLEGAVSGDESADFYFDNIKIVCLDKEN